MGSPEGITPLLMAWEHGDESALDRLMPLVEKELKRIASGYIRRERVGHTLQTTALVNEAYLKLVNQDRIHWRNRSHFFGVAAICMRRVLLDYVKSQRRVKRGGNAERIALSDATLISDEKSSELLALDEALQALAKLDLQKSRIVEMRYFGGYSVVEVAAILAISESTVERQWRMARAWLRHRLGNSTDRTALIS